MSDPLHEIPAPASLVARRLIRASPAFLFEAWTRAEQLTRWWGPAGVTGPEAAVDLRVGGGYRIANRFPDGRLVWIAGEFEVVTPPDLLVYTWRIEPQQRSERVTVRFQARGEATEVIVIHENIADAAARQSHEGGWDGCLAGLQGYAESGRP
jgi:uncharacterized protein YndB with AHSA1/START domain